MSTTSLTEYAEAHGTTRQAAAKWKRRGTLVMSGRAVEVEASDARMKEAGLGRYRSTIMPEAILSDGEDDAPGEGMSDERVSALAEQLVASKGVLSLHDAQALKETYLGRMRELEYHLKVGTVVLIEDAVRLTGIKLARVRTRLLAIPTNVALAAARATSPAVAEALIRDAIYDALRELTTDRGTADALLGNDKGTDRD